MPYYGGNSMYPVYGYQTQPNAYSYAQQPSVPQQQSMTGIQWVDGEIGAKAFQMPQGWPASTPIALWDTNDQIIYLKSFNQMGMPNPLQKIHYTMDEPIGGYLADPNKNVSSTPAPENYVTKEDFAALKSEIREMIKNMPNQRIQNGQQNRGGST